VVEGIHQEGPRGNAKGSRLGEAGEVVDETLPVVLITEKGRRSSPRPIICWRAPGASRGAVRAQRAGDYDKVNKAATSPFTGGRALMGIPTRTRTLGPSYPASTG